jgi:hypothetical protein
LLRQRLGYLVMSLFVAWHTLAIAVAPAPSNALTESLRKVLQPYLTLFRLDDKWDFFAPNIGAGSLFRYVIEDQAGWKHTFTPAEKLSWIHPGYLWFRFWYYAIMENPELYADDAAARFCRMHADLHPVDITLLELREKEFTPSDLLAGKQRTDPEFYTVTTIKRDKCAQ